MPAKRLTRILLIGVTPTGAPIYVVKLPDGESYTASDFVTHGPMRTGHKGSAVWFETADPVEMVNPQRVS